MAGAIDQDFFRRNHAHAQLLRDLFFAAFDSVYYRYRYSDMEKCDNPFAHFWHRGCGEGRTPSPYFCPDFYTKLVPAAAECPYGAFYHFIRFGMQQCIDPSMFFDHAYYMANNSKVRRSYMLPFENFLRRGSSMSDRTSVYFDPAYYLHQNLDVARKGLAPLSHYLRCGRAEGRAPMASMYAPIAADGGKPSILSAALCASYPPDDPRDSFQTAAQKCKELTEGRPNHFHELQIGPYTGIEGLQRGVERLFKRLPEGGLVLLRIAYDYHKGLRSRYVQARGLDAAAVAAFLNALDLSATHTSVREFLPFRRETLVVLEKTGVAAKHSRKPARYGVSAA